MDQDPPEQATKVKHLRFLSNIIMLHESNNGGGEKNPIKYDCVSLMSSIGGEFIQQLGPVEWNLRGLICVEYQFNAQMHFWK